MERQKAQEEEAAEERGEIFRTATKKLGLGEEWKRGEERGGEEKKVRGCCLRSLMLRMLCWRRKNKWEMRGGQGEG